MLHAMHTSSDYNREITFRKAMSSNTQEKHTNLTACKLIANIRWSRENKMRERAREKKHACLKDMSCSRRTFFNYQQGSNLSLFSSSNMHCTNQFLPLHAIWNLINQSKRTSLYLTRKHYKFWKTSHVLQGLSWTINRRTGFLDRGHSFTHSQFKKACGGHVQNLVTWQHVKRSKQGKNEV